MLIEIFGHITPILAVALIFMTIIFGAQAFKAKKLDKKNF
tara:strand:- start:129 stop:248 length:120 start_codon:yes stop_codon:yes gene_type:complete